MTFQTREDAYEPTHTASQTAHALEELQLYGYRPFDEPDPRPMPDGQRLAVAVADIFDALTSRRPYKEPWTFDETFAELRRMVDAGTIDGRCVEVLVRCREEIHGIREAHPDV